MELEVRGLRYFVVVAEELHFTRAAARLYVAQQALSRDIRRLEDRVGVPLFERSTRRVALTSAGELLLTRARELLELHDRTVRELRGADKSGLVVDVVGQGLTPAEVLEVARHDGEVEFFAEFHSGLDEALPLLQSRRLDVTFGRWTYTPGLEHRVVRFERLAVLLPDTHPLAALPEVPLEALRDAQVCWRAGTHVSADWEGAVLQLLSWYDADPALAHPRVRDQDEVERHLQHRNAPILTLSTQHEFAGAVVRPLVDPVAAYPWSMIWRSDLDHPGLTALHRAIDQLGRAGEWLLLPDGTWLPEPEMTDLFPTSGD